MSKRCVADNFDSGSSPHDLKRHQKVIAQPSVGQCAHTYFVFHIIAQASPISTSPCCSSSSPFSNSQWALLLPNVAPCVSCIPLFLEQRTSCSPPECTSSSASSSNSASSSSHLGADKESKTPTAPSHFAHVMSIGTVHLSDEQRARLLAYHRLFFSVVLSRRLDQDQETRRSGPCPNPSRSSPPPLADTVISERLNYLLVPLCMDFTAISKWYVASSSLPCSEDAMDAFLLPKVSSSSTDAFRELDAETLFDWKEIPDGSVNIAAQSRADALTANNGAVDPSFDGDRLYFSPGLPALSTVFRVQKVRWDVSPQSPVPSQWVASHDPKSTMPSYTNFYNERYGLSISDQSQPLWEATPCSMLALNMLRHPKKGAAHNRSSTLLVPELCRSSPWKYSTFAWAKAIPCVVWAWENALTVCELQVRVFSCSALLCYPHHARCMLLPSFS